MSLLPKKPMARVRKLTENTISNFEKDEKKITEFK